MLLTINQQPENMAESLNTIRFGMAAGAIKIEVKTIQMREEDP
jgi:hypothetical protein